MEDTNLFEQPVSRLELLKKVAVYTPPIVLAGRALMSPGVAFAETSTESSVSSTSSSTSPPPTTPLSALQNDLALLVAIPATGQRSVDKKVAEAVGDLTEATISSQWADGYTLLAASGDNVFFDLKWAANALSTSGSPDGTVPGVIADIVTQAGTIANTAVSGATLTAKLAKKAQRKLQKGAQRSAAGNVSGAIAAYMHAWDIAVTGVEAADPDDTDADD